MRTEQGSEGALQLQGWLLIAKQRALRDQAPRGLRLNITSDGNGLYVSECQYIEQPPNFSGGSVTLTAGSTTVTCTADLSGGFSDPTTYPVQPGDYLVVQGIVYQIDSSPAITAAPTGSSFPITRKADTAMTAVTNYNIVRKPRPLAGEDTLELPRDVGVDWALSRAGGAVIPGAAGNTFDILFGPQGTVIGTAAQYDKIILWVRDRSLDPNQGDQSLITIYCRTNALAFVPVNTDANVGAGDPYYYTQDGRASGQ
jgi:hypothetical protein